MRIYGLDFTSAPSYRKPITGAVCTIMADRLRVEGLITLTSFVEFEQFLSRSGPWLAGLDFPFGQPRKLIQNLGWPDSWADYVEKIAALGKSGFVATLAAYRQARPPGDKQHLRAADFRTASRSPMMLYGVPVGKMFFEGAPRLLKSGVSILPCRPNADPRLVIEAYPALVARRWAGSYKSDAKKKQSTTQQTARRQIVEGLRSDQLRTCYGFSVELSDMMAEYIVQDPTGDRLDAVLCAIQAAWAYTQAAQNYGIPSDCDAIEGWIVDPDLL